MPNPPPTSGGGWRFVPFISANGRCEVMDTLDGLRDRDERKYAQFRDVIMREMEVRGPFQVGGGYWESVGGGLYEIRFGRGRIYCSLRARTIMMYRAVIKFWKKFRPSDRAFCEKCKIEFESADYDQESREYLYRNLCRKRSPNGTA